MTPRSSGRKKSLDTSEGGSKGSKAYLTGIVKGAASYVPGHKKKQQTEKNLKEEDKLINKGDK